MTDTLFEHLVYGFFGVLVLTSVAFWGSWLYWEYVSEKVYLRKDQWTCSASHQEWQSTGKSGMLVTLCDTYQRNR